MKNNFKYILGAVAALILTAALPARAGDVAAVFKKTVSLATTAIDTTTSGTQFSIENDDSVSFIAEADKDSVQITFKMIPCSPTGQADSTAVANYVAGVTKAIGGRCAIGSAMTRRSALQFVRPYVLITNSKSSTQSITVTIYRVRR